MTRHLPTLYWAVGLTGATVLGAFIVRRLLEYPWPITWIAVATGVTSAAFLMDRLARLRDAENASGGGEHTDWIASLRIPEPALLWACLIGGTLGGLVSMLGRRAGGRSAAFRFYMGIIVGFQIGFALHWVITQLTS